MNVTSILSIAEQADRAASWWVAHPDAPKPPCPFDATEQPDHYDRWMREMSKALLKRSAEVAGVEA